jgi:predicted NUDIX family NTP pyrophosphohydrolase
VPQAVKTSAGLLMYRRSQNGLEVLLVHPGGPFWARKDTGAWSIPKGEVEPGEEPLAAAIREFEEETGIKPQGPYRPLLQVRQAGGKSIVAWAFEGDCDPENVFSNTFSMEWPPGSGRQREFPEIDRAGWFNLEQARQKINPAQAAFLSDLQQES